MKAAIYICMLLAAAGLHGGSEDAPEFAPFDDEEGNR